MEPSTSPLKSATPKTIPQYSKIKCEEQIKSLVNLAENIYIENQNWLKDKKKDLSESCYNNTKTILRNYQNVIKR